MVDKIDIANVVVMKQLKERIALEREILRPEIEAAVVRQHMPVNCPHIIQALENVATSTAMYKICASARLN